MISAADITAGRLRFAPDLNETGSPYATLGFQVSDGTAFSAATYTLTATVTPVNDAPAGTDATVTTNEDIAHVFTVANFGFTDVDAGDTMSAVRIDSLPAAGTLTLERHDGRRQRRDSGGRHHRRAAPFQPRRPTRARAGYASFTFSVRDQANAFDAAPNTMRIDVTPVDDLPVANNDMYATNEDTPLVIGPAAACSPTTPDSATRGPSACNVARRADRRHARSSTPTAASPSPRTRRLQRRALAFTYQIPDADGDVSQRDRQHRRRRGQRRPGAR